MKNRLLLLIVLSITAFSCKNTIRIVDKPIIFNDLREELTLEYLGSHYDLKQKASTIIPKMVVVHWTQIPSFEKSFNAFNPEKLPNYRGDIKTASALNVSSQFLVDQDGTIYRLMPETTMARHVIGLNHCAIGIENVGGTDEMPLTEAQLKSNIELIKYLKEKYPIDYVIGHYEYTFFDGHKLWLEKDDGYRTVKVDPGKKFLISIREGLSEFDWKEMPDEQVYLHKKSRKEVNY